MSKSATELSRAITRNIFFCPECGAIIPRDGTKHFHTVGTLKRMYWVEPA